MQVNVVSKHCHLNLEWKTAVCLPFLFLFLFSRCIHIHSPDQQLSCNCLRLRASSHINFHVLTAIAFWKAETESLYKQQLHLGMSKCTEMYVWSCAFSSGTPRKILILFHSTGISFAFQNTE